jgi:hypothetical protein
MLPSEPTFKLPLACILAKKPRMRGTAVWSRLVADVALIPAFCVSRLVT